MHMADRAKRFDAFLQSNERNILTQAGRISQDMAEEHVGGGINREMDFEHVKYDVMTRHGKAMEIAGMGGTRS